MRVPSPRIPSVSRRACLVALGACAQGARAATTTMVVRYPQIGLMLEDPRRSFTLVLLQAALATQGIEARFEATPLAMERPRAFQSLLNRDVDVVWASLSEESERSFRAIYVPHYRGLQGQRIFLVHRDQQERFAAVRSVQDLAAFTGGQGVGWADTAILRAAGLKVVTNVYDALFRMLAKGSIDYFPRGALEAPYEWSARAAQFPELVVEQRLLLSYRSDQIFYVHPDNTALARPIEAGLRRLHESGEFQRLFEAHPYVRAGLQAAHLDRRLRIALDNPTLSPAARAIPDRYWL